MTAGQQPGARVMFRHGAVRVAPAIAVPEGALAAHLSVISPGTELRRLAATRSGPDHPAGYMTLTGPAGPGGQRLLAPVPHGTPVRRTDSRALRIPFGIGLELVALARFQLMAAVGLARVSPAVSGAQTVCVVGGGPVALGCVLEFHRLGVAEVLVVTRHPRPAAADLPGVSVSPAGANHTADVVIDCTGRVDTALELVATGGVLGLLGTPEPTAVLLADQVHRRGLSTAGMHELAGYHPPSYQDLFTTVLAWEASHLDRDMVHSWCRQDPRRPG
jgi:threonine dehydrogenase-like Zn-dependent dehydrogenase